MPNVHPSNHSHPTAITPASWTWDWPPSLLSVNFYSASVQEQGLPQVGIAGHFCSCWRWTIVASSRWAESPELSNDFPFKHHSVLALVQVVVVRIWEISVGLFQGLSQCWPWTVFYWLLEYFSTGMKRVKPDAFRIQINCIFRKGTDWKKLWPCFEQN